MTNKKQSQENQLPLLGFSQTAIIFANEFPYRLERAECCLEWLYSLRKKRGIKALPNYAKDQFLRGVLRDYIILQVACLFDGIGKLSIKIHFDGGKVTLDRRRLKNIFPIPEPGFRVFSSGLQDAITKHSGLIKKSIAIRNGEIAHAGTPFWQEDPKGILLKGFPYAEIRQLLSGLVVLINTAMYGESKGQARQFPRIPSSHKY